MIMDDAIFVLIFQQPTLGDCGDVEVRICKAQNKEEASKIAIAYRNKYYKGWSIAVNSVIWSEDKTAYVYCDYK